MQFRDRVFNWDVIKIEFYYVPIEREDSMTKKKFMEII